MPASGILTGKVAVITGGSGGIGAATVSALRRQGATVSIWDIASPSGRSFEQCHAASYIHADITSPAELASAAAQVDQELGGIDLLINVAGGGTQKTVAGMTTEDWDDVVALNLSGPFYAMKVCAPSMRTRGGGRIVTVASLAATRMSMNLGASYTAAKAGILGLTRHAAFEFARDGILVNAVLPGPVMTPLMSQKSTPEALEFVTKTIPLGRFLTPEEVAEPIVFFCSPASSGCTGTCLLVDGGYSAGVVSPDVYFRGRT